MKTSWILLLRTTRSLVDNDMLCVYLLKNENFHVVWVFWFFFCVVSSILVSHHIPQTKEKNNKKDKRLTFTGSLKRKFNTK